MQELIGKKIELYMLGVLISEGMLKKENGFFDVGGITFSEHGIEYHDDNSIHVRRPMLDLRHARGKK